MIFSKKLIKGKISNIYNNLIFDVQLENKEVVPVFCPDFENSKKTYETGKEVWLQKFPSKQQKLSYEIVFIKENDNYIMVNYRYISNIFSEAFEQKKIEELSKYDSIRYLQKNNIKHSLLELSNQKEKCTVYLCSIYNKLGADVIFPSNLDFREMKIYTDFEQLRKQGQETYVLMIVPRIDHNGVKFCWHIDPIGAGKTFDEAKKGLKFICYGCNLDKNGIEISNKIKIEF
ncbi:MAG: DNA/RNA nuclease SfsA [Alphaproteobacteria bacterium]|nr:DNA/RNA nuclease SfsA [Alphaproteobacteria bacterium]